jgi:hypothetical protein
LNNYQLTDEDKKRIRHCDFYLQAKEVIESTTHYSEVNVGEVYSISYKSAKDGDKRYISSHGSSTKDRYIVVEKDEGFVFAKRLNSNGGTGKDVVCLTIRFPMPKYSIELDDAQAESIIFSQEQDFDPFKFGKDLKRRKDRARNLNKKNILKFKTAKEAFSKLSTLKVGDSIWDCTALFGEGIVKWEVSEVVTRPTDKTPAYGWDNQVIGYGKEYIDQDHNKAGIDNILIVKVKTNEEMPKSRRWASKIKDITFKDLMNDYRYYFLKRPVSAEDDQA